jgi:hypothetical protein
MVVAMTVHCAGMGALFWIRGPGGRGGISLEGSARDAVAVRRRPQRRRQGEIVFILMG